MRYFLELSYRGTAYNGWQRQTSAPSVQQTLERALSTLLRHDVEVVGAGRTDSGVHAEYYVAHFDTPQAVGEALAAVVPPTLAACGDRSPRPAFLDSLRRSVASPRFPEALVVPISLSALPSVPGSARCPDLLACPAAADFMRHLNAILPADIAVASVTRVAETAHARFDAVSREYRYYIRNAKSPFFYDLEWEYRVALDLDAMNRAAALLPAHSDFTTFSKLHSGNKTNICKVFEAHWQELDGMSVFTIRADRFLRNMVRSLVGAMVDVGRGKITVDDFAAALGNLDRSRATSTAPAHGLYLSDVTYPAEIFTRPSFCRVIRHYAKQCK